MAAPVVSGTVALMVQANPDLTPNLVKAILQFTSQEYPGYDALTQGTGFLNARGAVQLAEYFHAKQLGSAYPSMHGWSRQIFWGNKRVRGGVLTPGGTAWGSQVVWGSHPSGTNIVWGENCLDASCDGIVWGNNIVWGEAGDDNIVWGNTDDDNIVWGNGDDDNIVWGNGDDDNIVWGNADDDNIVWGNDCGGENCDNIVWGNSDDDNIVWGNAEGIDNIVWGNSDDDNIVWGNNDDDNIVWGNNDDDNIVWGNTMTTTSSGVNSVTQIVQQIVFGDETNQVNSLPSSMWDALFPLDASCRPPARRRRRATRRRRRPWIPRRRRQLNRRRRRRHRRSRRRFRRDGRGAVMVPTPKTTTIDFKRASHDHDSHDRVSSAQQPGNNRHHERLEAVCPRWQPPPSRSASCVSKTRLRCWRC
jgi:hypothetical protein